MLLPFNKPLTADLLLQDTLNPMTETFQEIMVDDYGLSIEIPWIYWVVKLDARKWKYESGKNVLGGR